MELYIKEVFNNYYNMSLEDRIKLTERLEDLHEEYKYDDGFGRNYSESLTTIKTTAYYILKCKNLKEFYKNLDNDQKKELQTQVYLTSEKVKSWIWVPKIYEKLGIIYNPDEEYEEEAKEPFELDLERLNEELKRCDGFCYDSLSAEKIISTFSRTYSTPSPSEFNKAIKEAISTIRENINDSTREMFDSLRPIQQLYSILNILIIPKEELNYWIEYRRELRKNKAAVQKTKRYRENNHKKNR